MVPYLAVGELLLVAPGRRATRLVVATMLWVTFASTAAVLAAAGRRRRELARGRGDAAQRRDGRPLDDDPGGRSQHGRARWCC